MKTKTVSHTIATLPDLSEEARARLLALRDRPETENDLSDIAEMEPARFDDAVRGRFYRPVKQQITARIDADVLDWLKSGGKGYQSRLNAILRREMLAASARRKKA